MLFNKFLGSIDISTFIHPIHFILKLTKFIYFEIFRFEDNFADELFLCINSASVVLDQLLYSINTALFPLLHFVICCIAQLDSFLKLGQILSKFFEFSPTPLFRHVHSFRSKMMKLKFIVILAIVSFLIPESFSFKL